MPAPKGHKWYGGGQPKITEDTPLTPQDWKFVHAYIRAETETNKVIGKASSDKIRAGTGYANHTANKLRKPNVRKVINELMEERTKKTIAESNEVMEYFTSVMRGEVKDQFGLDAPLAERTSAAKELKKIFIDDVEKGKSAQAQQVIVNIDMSRDEEPETVVDIQQLSD